MALAILGVSGLFAAVRAAQSRPIPALAALAYLAAVEPAVRRYASELPYFALQYLTAGVLGLLLLRRRPQRVPAALVLYAIYFCLELAGLLQAESMTHARAVLVPSGLLFLFVLVSTLVPLSLGDALKVLDGFLVGAVSLAALVGRAYVTGEAIQWTRESNWVTSGDMGPNQVSVLLGLGALVAWVRARDLWRPAKLTLLAMSATSALLMLLTFSRGGAYILAGALFVYTLLSGRGPARTAGSLAAGCALAAVAVWLAAERSEGRLLERYADRDPSNRLVLFDHGWRMFVDHPLTGVGTGRYYQVVSGIDYFGVTSGAHNELTRAMAEHGLVGLAIWCAFGAALLARALRLRSRDSRALAFALAASAVASMLYNGLKLTIQPVWVLLALGLGDPPRRTEPPTGLRASPPATGRPWYPGRPA